MICDGWSGGLLIGELAAIYSARRVGRLIAGPASFKDFALANEADTPEVAEAIAYLARPVAKLSLPLNLPTDRPRPAVRTANADAVQRAFDLSMYQALKRAAGAPAYDDGRPRWRPLKLCFYRLSGQTGLVVRLGAPDRRKPASTVWWAIAEYSFQFGVIFSQTRVFRKT